MIVAHISDLHIKRRGLVLNHMPHVAGPLRRALAAIASLPDPPSCIIATGDLTENGTVDEYRRLREILRVTDVPVYLLPGNHDHRGAMREAFDDHAYLGTTGPVLYVVDSPLLRLIAVDTSEYPTRGGYLDDERLAWLERVLQERPRTPTILAMHHPPFRTGVRHFDSQQFEGRERLGEIVRVHRQIRRIICGHVHQLLRCPWNGTVAISAPSTAPTLVLHARGRGLFFEPGGFLLHHYDWDADVSTQLVRPEEFSQMKLSS